MGPADNWPPKTPNMHKQAPGIKVLWVFTLIVGLLLAGFAVVNIIVEEGLYQPALAARVAWAPSK